MALDLSLVDVKEILSSFLSSLSEPLQDKLILLIGLSKILLVLAIIYFLLLIISKIYSIRDSRNLRKISKNTEEINEKLSLLVGKKRKK